MGHFRINGISRRITLTLLCGMLILMLVLGVYMLNVISHTNQESRTYALSMTDNMTDLQQGLGHCACLLPAGAKQLRRGLF